MSAPRPAGSSCMGQVMVRATSWYRAAGTTARTASYAERSAILLVPSYVARVERNVVINSAHADAAGIETSLAEPVWWDERLFG